MQWISWEQVGDTMYTVLNWKVLERSLTELDGALT